MEELVNLLNSPALGTRTIDCCFGHPAKDIAVNHHSSSFVGFEIINKDKYTLFWKAFFKNHYGKVKVCPHKEGFAQFSILSFDSVGQVLGTGHHILEIIPWHNPVMRQEGIDEKNAAIKMLEDFTKEYVKKNDKYTGGML